MPRSVLLFRHYMADRGESDSVVTQHITPHAVASDELMRADIGTSDAMTVWWQNPVTIVLLAREYAKYLYTKYSPSILLSDWSV